MERKQVRDKDDATVLCFVIRAMLRKDIVKAEEFERRKYVFVFRAHISNFVRVSHFTPTREIGHERESRARKT